jgi:hypothetical protein
LYFIVIYLFYFFVALQELPVEKPDWEAINNPQTSCTLRGGERAYSSDCDEAEAEDATSSSSSRYVLATALAHVEHSRTHRWWPGVACVCSGRSASCIQATWVGHSTFLVQMEGVNFLTGTP